MPCGKKNSHGYGGYYGGLWSEYLTQAVWSIGASDMQGMSSNCVGFPMPLWHISE
jgi:hypothetical protein